MRNQIGYARLNSGIIMCFLILSSVLIYQYIAFRKPQPVITENGASLASFSSLQLFPQTMPLSTASAYELVVTDDIGARFTIGRFALLDQDHLSDLNGKIIANAVFPLPRPVTGLRDAEIRLVEKDRGSQPFSISFLSGSFAQERAVMGFFAPGDTVEGQFMLGTPTDGNNTVNERSGVWFGSFPQNATTLHLPILKQGWVYEGWALVDGQSLTTGRFRTSTARDLFSGFSGNQASIPSIPGEDFLLDPPVLVFPSLTFPVDLAGDLIQVSIEPDLNGVDPTGQAPFGFTILQGEVPRRATPAVLYDLASLDEQTPKATVVLRP